MDGYRQARGNASDLAVFKLAIDFWKLEQCDQVSIDKRLAFFIKASELVSFKKQMKECRNGCCSSSGMAELV